ncbi:MAG: aminotransferase class III-fold pyridoxal phosphate-dependent enzyme, partial [Dongiaceae bacterium]
MAIPTAPALSNTGSDQIWRADRDHFLHPWTHFDSFKAEGSLVIAEGQGAYVYDSAGKRYLDGIGGLWCVNIGYGNEEMVQAIADQAHRLAFFSSFVDTTNPPAAELAAKLAELAPGDLNHVCYTCTGSDANDTAVRLAHYYHARRGEPSKKHIIARLDGYHGSTYLGMSLTGRASDRSPNFHYLTDFVHHVSSPNSYRRPTGMAVEEFCDHLVGELEQTIQAIGPDKVAAFIAEPVLGAGGVIVPPPGYHRRTAEL